MGNKSRTISRWKFAGVIYGDFEELYYIYMNTLKCYACNKEFKNSYVRCLDHDHSTGLFRAIVCRGCNSNDRYIKYPNGYDKKIWYKNNKEKIAERTKIYRNNNKGKFRERTNKKYDCECGGKYTHCHKQHHLKTIKHIAWYMEQVD